MDDRQITLDEWRERHPAPTLPMVGERLVTARSAAVNPLAASRRSAARPRRACSKRCSVRREAQ
jgi:hypothetical protein